MRKFFQLLDSTQFKVLASFGIILVSLAIRGILGRVINQKVTKLNAKYLWRQTSNYIATIFALLNLTVVWFEGYKSVLSLLSLVSAALVLANKELVGNFTSYFVIIWRGLFEVGDRIQIGEISGDVMDFGLLYISVAEVGNWVDGDEPTGRIIKIPNHLVIIQTVANYSRGASSIWNEIYLRVSLKSDLRAVKVILEEVAELISHKLTPEEIEEIKMHYEELLFPEHNPKVTIAIENAAVTFTLRYLCRFYKRRNTENIAWELILERLSKVENVELI
mgnify:CR=1 FL=1